MMYCGPDQLKHSIDPVSFTIQRRESWQAGDYVGGRFDCDEWLYWFRATGPFDAKPGDVVTVIPAKDLLG